MLNFNSKPKNLNFKGFVSYKKITKILQTYKILMMPYQKKVDVLIKGVDVSNYFSPLKLFEYMAAGKIIVASKLKVYSKILKHKGMQFCLNLIILMSGLKQSIKYLAQVNLII